MQPLPDGLKSPLASPGSLSLAGQPLWWELKVLGMVGGIPLWLVLIAGHGAVTQGEAESGPRASQVPACAWGGAPWHPSKGLLLLPWELRRGVWVENQENWLKLRGRGTGMVTPARGSAP